MSHSQDKHRSHTTLHSVERTEDSLIAIECQLGNPKAWRALLQRFEGALRYYLERTVGPACSEEVLQEVWLKAFKTIHRLENPSSIRAWLYRIAHGAMVDELRKRGRQRELLVNDYEDSVDDSGGFDSFDALAIHKALQQLSLAHREVLLLFFLEDMGVNEIAETIGVPPGTVKSRLFHAKKACRRCIEEMGYG